MRRRKRLGAVSLFSFQDIVTGMCGIMIFMVLVQVLGLVDYRDNVEYTVEDSKSYDEDALKREIGELEKRLERIRQRSRTIAAAPKEAPRPGEYEKVAGQFTEKERIIAALVSQMHDLETQVAAARDADAKSRERIKEMERTRRLLEQQIANLGSSKGVTLIPQRGESKIPFYVICSSQGLDIRRPFEANSAVGRIPASDIKEQFSEFLADLDHTTHAAVLLVRPTGVAAMNVAVELLKQNNFAFGRDPLEEWAVVTFGEAGQ